jgi:hypothetical protein
MSLYLKDSIDGTRKVLDPKNTINLQDPKKKKKKSLNLSQQCALRKRNQKKYSNQITLKIKFVGIYLTKEGENSYNRHLKTKRGNHGRH